MPLNYDVNDSFDDLEEDWTEARLAQADAMERLLDDTDLASEELDEGLLDDVYEQTEAFADIDEVMHSFLSKPPPATV